MELYPIDIAIHLLNIIVLYVLLRLLVWKPVRKFMAGREERIQSQLDAVAKAQADAQASQTEYKQKLAAAQTTCEQLMAEGRKQAAVSGQKILAQAQEEAGRILQQAQADAQAEKVRAMDDAKGELAHLAVELAGRVLRFDEETKSRIAQGRSDRKGTRDGVLKTAHALTSQEQAQVTAQLEELLGCGLNLDYQVDPQLIGGYAAYIGGNVYDFSYASQLAAMKQQLA